MGLENRFWSKVDRSQLSPGGCWLWTRATNAGGYGLFGLQRRALLAHRVAYAALVGVVPDDLCVCHRCDTPGCVNPAHLFLGTHADNSDDKVRKGRQSRLVGDRNPSRSRPECLARGDRSGARKHPERLQRGDAHYFRIHPELVKRGVEHAQSRLTDEQIAAIRGRYAVGGITQQELAEQYGIDQTHVSRIVRNKSWAHVP